MKNYKPRNKVVLKELLYDQIIPQPTSVVEKQSEETMSLNQENLPPQCNEMVIRPPICYKKIKEAQQVVVSDNEQDDLLTYQHAMKDPDKEKWQDAMKLKIESMHSNSVWELVGPPEYVRPIGYKWN